jgi:hypothetical protein
MVGDERKLMEESNSSARNTNLARDIRDSLAGNFYRYRGSTYITEGINQVDAFVEAYNLSQGTSESIKFISFDLEDFERIRKEDLGPEIGKKVSRKSWNAPVRTRRKKFFIWE